MVDVAHAGQRASMWGMARLLAELVKLRITSVVTLSVATGFIAFAQTINREIILPMSGTFLLACGSAVLNQVQEAALDGRMMRTRRRPIPSGRIRRDTALLVSVALIGAGMTTLASVPRHTLTVLALGALAVLWYNGVYVMLKRWTAFAVVPGSVIGAIPPVIGWVSAGGLATDGAAVMLAFFFFLWQIPHFWLLLVRYGDEYQRAGMPSLTATFTTAQLARITCVWIWSVATCGVMLATGEHVRVPFNAVIVVGSLWLGVSGLSLLQANRLEQLAMPAFMRINIYVLVVMLALVANGLWA